MHEQVKIIAHGTLWQWREDGSSRAGTLYLDVEGEAADAVRRAVRAHGPHVGPIPADMRIGDSSWKGGLYDASRHSGYLITVPAKVAASEKLSDGSTVTAQIAISL